MIFIYCSLCSSRPIFMDMFYSTWPNLESCGKPYIHYVLCSGASDNEGFFYISQITLDYWFGFFTGTCAL